VNPFVVGVATVTLCVSIFVRRHVKNGIHMIIALAVGSLLAALPDNWFGIEHTKIATLSSLPAGLPPVSAPDISIETLSQLIPISLAIAALGLTEASRLSDIALNWMATEAKRAGLLVNDDLLSLFGRHNGPQHDECRVGISFLGMHFKWRQKARKMVDNATIHWSVYKRFEEPTVLIYDEERRYRPASLEHHEHFSAACAAEKETPGLWP
jgi:hypothetical protein